MRDPRVVALHYRLGEWAADRDREWPQITMEDFPTL
jgi:hypothetical protein